MRIEKRLLICSVASAALSAAAAQPVSAAPWVRCFVVGAYEYAFRYGGRADFTRSGEIEPGVDCPHGSTSYFSNEASAKSILSRQKWRSQQEIDWVTHPPGLEKVRAPNLTQRHIWHRALAYRGYRRDIETYVNPFAAEDPGQPEVTSRIGEGFNLDGKIKPNDFVSPDGEKGIDNQLYRAWGCDAPWRGENGNGTLVLRSNDKMLEGLFTIVIRLSGNKDPMNDDDATLEIGYSPDQIMKDARGNVGIDYSYRILKSEQYTKLKARIKNGVAETGQADIHMPQIAWFYNQLRDAFFRQGKIRVVPNSDGTAAGLVGGYRDFRDLYTQNAFTQSGGVQGVREHEDHVALYYAMRRNADGMFNAKTGRYEGISTAYRMKLTPAFVVDPDKPMDIPLRESEAGRKKAFDDTSAAMIKAVNTLVPQEVPPGSTELTAVDGVVIGRGGVQIPARGGRGYGGNRAVTPRK